MPDNIGPAWLAANFSAIANYRESKFFRRTHSDKMVILDHWATELAAAMEVDEEGCRELGFMLTDDGIWFRDYMLVNELHIEQYCPKPEKAAT